MRTPSRRLPPVPEPQRPHPIAKWGGLAVLAGGASWIVWSAIKNPVIGIVLLGVVGIGWASAARQQHRTDRRLAVLNASRPGDPLCRFARAVDCRQRDTWIVRAVFEALQVYLPTLPGRNAFPILPDDRLEDDLGLDFDDLDEDALVIAERCGRRLEPVAESPDGGKVVTVRDLLDFFERLPRVESAATAA